MADEPKETNEAEETEKPAPKPKPKSTKKMRIKISAAHRVRAEPEKKNSKKMWEPGQEVDCPEDRARKLISIGAAAEVK